MSSKASSILGPMSSSKTFQTEIQIRFRNADPAGISFFANVFPLSHDIFEDFIVDAGIEWKSWFNMHGKYLVPVRHTECDFLRPLLPGEKYQVTVSILSLSETSFQMQYQFSKAGKSHAQVKMTHVFVDATTKHKTQIPDDVRQKFTPYVVSP